MLTHAPWDAVPGLRHGFLGAAECAAAPGWETVLARVGVRVPLALPRQVHGRRVVNATSAGVQPEADGLASTTTGLLIGVVTADCIRSCSPTADAASWPRCTRDGAGWRPAYSSPQWRTSARRSARDRASSRP